MNYDVMFDQLEKEISMTRSDIENNKKNVIDLFEYGSGLKKIPRVEGHAPLKCEFNEKAIRRAGMSFCGNLRSAIDLIPKLNFLQSQLDGLKQQQRAEME
jgi:hypothetical protein